MNGRVMNMKIYENIINHKISTMTAGELMKYAKPFKIKLTRQESESIVNYLRGRKVNIFNDIERAKLIKEIAKIAGSETAREVNQIFIHFSSM